MSTLDPLRLPLKGRQLIEASAGTGKTWTLAALYVRLVLGHGRSDTQGLMPSQILVMTFTDAAVAELRERIRARLQAAVRGFDDAIQGKPPTDEAFLWQLCQDIDPTLWPECLRRLRQAVQAMDEAAIYTLNLLSATGTGILLSAVVGGLVMKYNPLQLVRIFFNTLWLVRYSLLTIVLMLALGSLTRYSGTDTTLGLAFANTGMFYPFFGTLMGWLGVALTGSDTASNVLFGGMQKVAAEQLGLSANLMGAANSSGGVMGKMVDAQSIVVASTATRWFNHEGEILRYVFFHSIALACLVGLLVTLQAYVYPFTLMVVH